MFYNISPAEFEWDIYTKKHRLTTYHINHEYTMLKSSWINKIVKIVFFFVSNNKISNFSGTKQFRGNVVLLTWDKQSNFARIRNKNIVMTITLYKVEGCSGSSLYKGVYLGYLKRYFSSDIFARKLKKVILTVVCVPTIRRRVKETRLVIINYSNDELFWILFNKMYFLKNMEYFL